MQDSSTNPFIPQESTAIRQQTEGLTSPLTRIVKKAMIVTGIIAVVTAIGLGATFMLTSRQDSKAMVELGKAIQPPGQLGKLVPVVSTVGFSLYYDNQLFKSYAETVPPLGKDTKTTVAGASYENDDLRVARDYGLVRLTPVVSLDTTRSATTIPPELVVSSTITPDILKQNQAKPDYKGLSDINLFIKLSTNERLAERNADDGSVLDIEATQPTSQKINGTEFQKVRYTTKNDYRRIKTEKYDDCYYTIQNEVPIAACITNVRPNNVNAAALDEQMLQSLTFQQPKTESLAIDSVASANNSSKLELTDKQFEYNTNPASMKVIAKSQPSVVRVGSLYCANLQLKRITGDTDTTLTDACTGVVSSGTLISSDGYVATTGHAILFDPKAAINGYINFSKDHEELLERLQHVTDYLVKIQKLGPDDVSYLKTGLEQGNQEAIAKIENIGSLFDSDKVTAVSETYSYAIQPSDKPIVFNTTSGTRPSFAYSDTVLSAKFVAADYDASKFAQYKFGSEQPATDTGILKIEKADQQFQNVPLAPGNGMKSNDNLNVVGYQTGADTSLTFDKFRNLPVVVNGKVEQTFAKDSHRLANITAPIIPGQDGAGVYDQQANLIGFGLYGLLYCPDQQCFASGTVRSSNDLLALIEKQNLSTGSLSPASLAWRQGVEEYARGNYAAAADLFGSAGTKYRFNPWAGAVQKLATSKIGSAGDTSLFNQLHGVMIGLLTIAAIVTAGLGGVYFLQKKRLDMLRVGHYGEAAPVLTAPTVQPAPPQQSWAPPQPQQIGWAPQQPPAQPPVPQPPQGWAQPNPQTPSGWAQPGPSLPQPPVQPGMSQDPQAPQPPQDPYNRG